MLIIRPSEALQTILKSYPHHNWNKVQLWDSFVPSGGPKRGELDARVLDNVAYLIHIILSLTETNTPTNSALIRELFGSPPKFHVEVVDKWWTLVGSGWQWFFDTTLKASNFEHYGSVQKTGLSEIDDWLTRMKSPQAENWKRGDSSELYFVCTPTSSMLAKLNKFPNHIWTRDTIWTLPTNIIENQEQHAFTLLKVLFFVELARSGPPFDTSLELMKELFGDAPHFRIETFDKWWKLEHTTVVGGFKQILEYPQNEVFLKAVTNIEPTDDSGTNYWLSLLAGISKQ